MAYPASMKPLFTLGRVCATPGALEAIRESGDNPLDFLFRHVIGDWGNLSTEDKAENDLSVREGFRILSSYKTSHQVKIWIITEADRSSTTLLLPSEY